MMMTKFLQAIGLACTALCLVPLQAVAQTKIRMGYIHVELLDAPPFHGLNRGYFSDQGIDLEMIKFDNGTQINQALAGGRIDVAIAGAALIQNFAVQGNGVIIAPAYIDNNELYALAASGVKTVADLTGKQVAFPLGTTAHILVDWALADAGLNMSSIKGVNMGYAAVTSALISGAVSAAVTQSVTARIIRREKPDVVKLADLKKFFPNRVVLGGLVASNAYYSANKPDLVSLTTAYVRSYREVWQDKKAQRDVYDKFYAKDQTFQEFDNNIMENIGFPSPEQWVKYLDDGSVAKWAIDVAKTFERAGALKTISDPKQFLDINIYKEAVRRSTSPQVRQ